MFERWRISGAVISDEECSVGAVPNRHQGSTQVDDEDALIDLFLFCCSASKNIDVFENFVRI